MNVIKVIITVLVVTALLVGYGVYRILTFDFHQRENIVVGPFDCQGTMLSGTIEYSRNKIEGSAGYFYRLQFGNRAFLTEPSGVRAIVNIPVNERWQDVLDKFSVSPQGEDTTLPEMQAFADCFAAHQDEIYERIISITGQELTVIIDEVWTPVWE